MTTDAGEQVNWGYGALTQKNRTIERTDAANLQNSAQTHVKSNSKSPTPPETPPPHNPAPGKKTVRVQNGITPIEAIVQLENSAQAGRKARKLHRRIYRGIMTA